MEKEVPDPSLAIDLSPRRLERVCSIFVCAASVHTCVKVCMRPFTCLCLHAGLRVSVLVCVHRRSHAKEEKSHRVNQ